MMKGSAIYLRIYAGIDKFTYDEARVNEGHLISTEWASQPR